VIGNIEGVAAPRRCNCLVWAIFRLCTRGGYLAMRRSFLSPAIPHLLWSRDLKVWFGYTALNPNYEGPLYAAAWFRGHVVIGDSAAVAEHARIVLAARVKLAGEVAVRLAVLRAGP